MRAVAPFALRMRRSEFMDRFIQTQKEEDKEILALFDGLVVGES
jgi:hypothetical protein